MSIMGLKSKFARACRRGLKRRKNAKVEKKNDKRLKKSQKSQIWKTSFLENTSCHIPVTRRKACQYAS